MLDEVAAPLGQGQRVVLAQVLLVQHLEADVLHLGDDPAGAGELTVGEDVAVDEVAGLLAPVVRPGDAVVEQHAARAQPVADPGEVGRVVAHPDVLGEPDRRHGVEAGLGDVAVVGVPHLGEVGQPLVGDRLARPQRLLARQGDPEHLHALACGVADHAAPAAADVEQPVTGLQAQLVEDQAVLVLLSLLQGRRGVGVAGARVRHRRTEHHLVEAVGHVVVVADRVGVAGHRVAQPLRDAPPAGQRLLRRRRGRREPLDAQGARGLDGRGGRGAPEPHRREVDEQVVGVARVHAFDVEVTRDVGPGQPQLTRGRGEVRRGTRRAQVQRPHGVGRAERGPVVRPHAQGNRPVEHGLDDLGDGHLLPSLSGHRLWVVGWVGWSRRSGSADRLGVEVGQPAVGVVPALEFGVVIAAVEPVELVLVVERLGVERLVTPQCGDLVLDAPVRGARPRSRVGRHRRPEADVDVQLTGPQRVERPRLLAAKSQRAQPDRLDRHLTQEPAQEVGGGAERDLDVLHHPLARRPALPGLEPVGHGEAPVEGDELPVDAAAQPAPGPQPAHGRVLRAEGPRAPEPVGVPAPQVVEGGEPVALRRGGIVLDGPVVDLPARVVARRARLLAAGPEHEVRLGGREHDAVDVVDPLTVERSVGDRGPDSRDEVVEVVEAHVAQGDDAAHRLELDAQPGRVAERAVGVGEAAEEVGVARPGIRRDHLTRTGEHVHLEHRLVRQPVAPRRRLDAEAGDRPTHRDGAQLRHDERGEPVRQRGVDEVLVGAHALHVGRAGVDVDVDDPGQGGGDRGGRRCRWHLVLEPLPRRTLRHPDHRLQLHVRS